MIGLVIEAMRKMVSRWIGSLPPALVPIAFTWTSPRRLTAVTMPGTSLRSTWPAMTACMRASRALDNPPVLMACSIRQDARARDASSGGATARGGRNVNAMATAPRPIAEEPMNIHA